MKDWELLEMIPPEQWTALIVAILGAIIVIVGAVGLFIKRWLDEKINDIRQEREIEKADAELKRQKEQAEIQAKLDETYNNRETVRFFSAIIEENRKTDKEVRASYERRETAFIEAMAKISSATQSIEVNSASTLALLKEHKDADDIMVIRQEKLMKQNDTTHERLSEMMNVLSTLSAKLETVAVGRSSDKKVLDEIKDAIEKVQASMKRLEDTTQPIPSLIESMKAPVVTTTESHKDDTIKLPDIDEKKDELHGDTTTKSG